jgi:hypothetical protein
VRKNDLKVCDLIERGGGREKVKEREGRKRERDGRERGEWREIEIG